MHEDLHGEHIPSKINLHNHPLDKKGNFKIISVPLYPRLAETISLNSHKSCNSNLMNERDSSLPLRLKL